MPATAAPYDRAWVLAQIGQDEALLTEIAQIFLEDAHDLREALEKAFRAQDCAATAEAAHTIKSAVGNFGAPQAVSAALTLELAARAGDTAHLAAACDALLLQLDRLEDALRTDLAATG